MRRLVSAASGPRWILAICGLALFTPWARAHEFWLAPDQWLPPPGSEVAVGGFNGTGFRGEVVPYPAPRVLRWELRGRAPVDLRPRALNGRPEFARIQIPRGGGVFAYASDFMPITLPGSDFEAYLREEGMDAALEAWRQSPRAEARERFRRCAKLWIGEDFGTVSRPCNLELEIVPLDDPKRVTAVRLRVLYQGNPVPRALVRAWNHTADEAPPFSAAARDSVGPVASARTDSDGIVTLELPGSGEWLVGTVHMVPSRDPAAEWESTWATLAFARSREGD